MEDTTNNVTRDRWMVSMLMVFSGILSFAFFQRQSLRLDEAQSIWQTSHSVKGIFNIIAQDVHVPLYHLLLHGWQYIFGNDVSVLRALSLIFFLFCIPAIYMLGKRAFNANVGLFAALLMAISPFMNWYGNEIRMYSLFVLLAILNQYFFIGIFRSRDEMSWTGYALTALFGIYSHYFFFLILVTEAIFYFSNMELFPRGSLKNFVITAALLMLAFAPWVTYVVALGKISNTQPTLPVPTTINLFNTLSQFVFGFQTDHLNTILVSLWPITVFFAFLALRRNRNITPETIFFILAFLLPNIMAFAASFVIEPIYLTRYLIFTLPAMYLLLGWLLSVYPFRVGRILKFSLVAIMLLTLTSEALSASTPVKENYREAAMYLNSKANPTDIIVVSAPFTIYPVQYYYHGPVTIATLPIWDQSKYGPIPAFNKENLPTDLETLKGSHRNMWLLLSYDQGYQDTVKEYMDTHFQRLDMVEFSSGLTLYEYKMRYDSNGN